MGELRQLGPQDAMFVGGEMPNVYQHTAGVLLLDCSETPGFGFETFRRHMEERIGCIPQFRWKLHEVPLGLDLPYWVEDEDFNLDHHIRRIAVPSPGNREALAEVVAYLYGRHMDRNRPLWEAWFIEGLEDGRYAVLQKIHHCLMDGAAAIKMSEIMWDSTPDAAAPKVDPVIAEARAGEVPDGWRLSLNAARHLSNLPFRVGWGIMNSLQHGVRKRLTGDGNREKKPAAPPTRFNANIGSDRGLVFGSLPLADIKAVKNHFGVTVNDVLLALISSTLRNYLLVQGELPEESLRTSIAVSLREEGDDSLGNKVTVATVTLATDLGEPAQRLKAIAEDSGKVKKAARSGGTGIVEIMQMLPPLLVNAFMRLTPPEQVPRLMGINLIVSNVRGGDNPMYVAGARLVALYPMSIINPGGGINITCGSFDDNAHFGITVEPTLVPDPWLIVDGLQDALEEYKSLLGGSGGTRKTTGARSAPAKRRRAVAGKKSGARGRSAGKKPPTPKRAAAARKR